MAANETYPTYPAPLAANGPNRQLGAASCDTDEERKANGMSDSRWCQVAANETHPKTAPLAANGPKGQLGAVACMRHMMGGNPLYRKTMQSSRLLLPPILPLHTRICVPFCLAEWTNRRGFLPGRNSVMA